MATMIGGNGGGSGGLKYEMCDPIIEHWGQTTALSNTTSENTRGEFIPYNGYIDFDSKIPYKKMMAAYAYKTGGINGHVFNCVFEDDNENIVFIDNIKSGDASTLFYDKSGYGYFINRENHTIIAPWYDNSTSRVLYVTNNYTSGERQYTAPAMSTMYPLCTVYIEDSDTLYIFSGDGSSGTVTQRIIKITNASLASATQSVASVLWTSPYTATFQGYHWAYKKDGNICMCSGNFWVKIKLSDDTIVGYGAIGNNQLSAQLYEMYNYNWDFPATANVNKVNCVLNNKVGYMTAGIVSIKDVLCVTSPAETEFESLPQNKSIGANPVVFMKHIKFEDTTNPVFFGLHEKYCVMLRSNITKGVRTWTAFYDTQPWNYQYLKIKY